MKRIHKQMKAHTNTILNVYPLTLCGFDGAMCAHNAVLDILRLFVQDLLSADLIIINLLLP